MDEPVARRILVIEDDAATYSALRVLLQRRGATVSLATNLADARAAMTQDTPDAIVLDLMLPDGNGMEILTDVRRRKLGVKVAVTTGISDTDQLQAVADLHPEALLRKPINLAELLRTVL